MNAKVEEMTLAMTQLKEDANKQSHIINELRKQLEKKTEEIEKKKKKSNQELELTISDLKKHLIKLDKEKERLLKRLENEIPKKITANVTEIKKEEENHKLKILNKKLQKENEKLSEELQAFDLDFFEEIEDLKYKYNEALRRLREYEDSDLEEF
mmetsp:Transcript_14974/g.22165  ORF Transcript_14974/g.22165 Transcript_14974/m.22165 type:complete len:155 (+) Transcript_14974:2586-3050(+)